MDSWSEIKYTYEGDSTYPMETKDSYHRGDHYGDYSYRYKYRYDDKNNLIERKKYTPRSDYDTTEGVLIRIDEYEYDSQGNRTLHKWRYGTDDGEEIKTTRYQYDKKGNLIEECLYEFIGDKEYVTSKVEYEHFEGMTACKARETSYQYEANSDYTIVNLRETDEGEWVWALGPYNEGYDEVHKDCWKVTYYTQEEIDQYWHDKEFSPVN